LGLHLCQGHRTVAERQGPSLGFNCPGRDNRVRQRQISPFGSGMFWTWVRQRERDISAASRSGVCVVQALTLMIVYVLTTFAVQFIGFLISRLVDYEWPTLGLMTFLILFMGAFGLAWPIAVRISEWLIRRSRRTARTGQHGNLRRPH